MPTKKNSKSGTSKRSTKSARAKDDMRPEYDFSKAKPNPYAEQFSGNVHYVAIDGDVMEYFGNSEAVNEALRALATALRATNTKKPA